MLLQWDALPKTASKASNRDVCSFKPNVSDRCNQLNHINPTNNTRLKGNQRMDSYGLNLERLMGSVGSP